MVASSDEDETRIRLAVATGYLQVCSQLEQLLNHMAARRGAITGDEAIANLRHWVDATRKSVYATVRKQSPAYLDDPYAVGPRNL